jgi:hypothetical protein
MDKTITTSYTVYLGTSTAGWSNLAPCKVSARSIMEPSQVSSSSILPDPPRDIVTIVSSADLKSIKFALPATATPGQSLVEQINAKLSGASAWPIPYPTD